jgi:phosphoribosylaminoimidazolecarboxamide formyltransferase/IMP cyclohydrolase
VAKPRCRSTFHPAIRHHQVVTLLSADPSGQTGKNRETIDDFEDPVYLLEPMKISRALISVSDKTGIVPFARRLHEMGVEIISTGGTASLLRSESIANIEIQDYTGSREILNGRVKTLHPKVHGGLLFLRDDPDHLRQAAANQIQPIDLVVVNLYPFEKAVSKANVPLEEALEQIDIGGPTMIRSAAKNFRWVTVVTDPGDYDAVLDELERHAGETTLALRELLAIKVFHTTSRYDQTIAKFLSRAQTTAASFTLSLPLEMHLRYGENPHQTATLYGSFQDYFQKLHGKELSYNNIRDIDAAAQLISEFVEPTVAIIKHTNPCGVGSDPDLREAWVKAFATDKQSPFGGVIICNRPLTESLARAISEIFSEVIIAPDFDPDARALLQKKKNLRLMKMLQWTEEVDKEPDVRSVVGGILVQDRDSTSFAEPERHVVSARPPTADEMKAMLFGWKAVKHVKSNAIVYSAKDRTLGIGAGQMSRVDSSRIAIWKAEEAGLSLKGSAVCSDAFFPFADGLIAASEAGATAAIQPGGSVRDKEVIAAADERRMAMVFTSVRHFRH